jgi:hypothetical protein
MGTSIHGASDLPRSVWTSRYDHQNSTTFFLPQKGYNVCRYSSTIFILRDALVGHGGLDSTERELNFETCKVRYENDVEKYYENAAPRDLSREEGLPNSRL